jgi:hypothetical protein
VSVKSLKIANKNRNQNGIYDITQTAIDWTFTGHGSFLNDSLPQRESEFASKAGLIVLSQQL